MAPCLPASCSAPTRVCRRSCATTSGRRGSTTCLRYRDRTWSSSRSEYWQGPGCSACRAGRRGPGFSERSGLHARRRLAAVCGSGRGCRRPRFACVAIRAAARPVVRAARRRGRAHGLESVRAARSGLRALVRGRIRDLHRRSSARARPRGLPGPAQARPRPRRLDRMWSCDRACPLAPLRGGPDLFRPSERDGRAQRWADARPRARLVSPEPTRSERIARARVVGGMACRVSRVLRAPLGVAARRPAHLRQTAGRCGSRRRGGGSRRPPPEDRRQRPAACRAPTNSRTMIAAWLRTSSPPI